MFFNLVVQADCAEVFFFFVWASDGVWRLGIVMVGGVGDSVGVEIRDSDGGWGWG